MARYPFNHRQPVTSVIRSALRELKLRVLARKDAAARERLKRIKTLKKELGVKLLDARFYEKSKEDLERDIKAVRQWKSFLSGVDHPKRDKYLKKVLKEYAKGQGALYSHDPKKIIKLVSVNRHHLEKIKSAKASASPGEGLYNRLLARIAGPKEELYKKKKLAEQLTKINVPGWFLRNVDERLVEFLKALEKEGWPLAKVVDPFKDPDFWLALAKAAGGGKKKYKRQKSGTKQGESMGIFRRERKPKTPKPRKVNEEEASVFGYGHQILDVLKDPEKGAKVWAKMQLASKAHIENVKKSHEEKLKEISDYLGKKWSNTAAGYQSVRPLIRTTNDLIRSLIAVAEHFHREHIEGSEYSREDLVKLTRAFVRMHLAGAAVEQLTEHASELIKQMDRMVKIYKKTAKYGSTKGTVGDVDEIRERIVLLRGKIGDIKRLIAEKEMPKERKKVLEDLLMRINAAQGVLYDLPNNQAAQRVAKAMLTRLEKLLDQLKEFTEFDELVQKALKSQEEPWWEKIRKQYS